MAPNQAKLHLSPIPHTKSHPILPLIKLMIFFNYQFTANRFLVVGGSLESSSGPSTEVIDVSNNSLTCNSFGELETGRSHSVGGLLENTPIVCGGTSTSIMQSCLIFGQSQTVTMTSKRYGAASVVLNTTTMWVMGGRDGSSSYDYISSSEFISLKNSVPGPSINSLNAYFCSVKYNESHVYEIGGYYRYSSSSEIYIYGTNIYNPLDNFSRTSGPAMNYRRRYPGCAVMHNGESSVIVVVGGHGCHSSQHPCSPMIQLNTVEILDPSLGQWTMGKKSHFKSKILRSYVTKSWQ